MPSSSPPLAWYRQLYFQVIVAVVLGVLAGVFLPEYAARLKPLGDGFIRMVKMMVAPIVFCTIVHGIASVGDLKKLGRVGIKALVYFEIVSTLALIIGLVVVNWMEPGTGITPPGEVFHVEDSAKAASLGFAEKAKPHSFVDFLLNIIPTSLFGPFVSGELLQVLFVSLLLAFSISLMGDKGKPALEVIDYASSLFFKAMQLIVKLAPIGAFGAMAYAVGEHGLQALVRLAALMAGFYLTAILFVIIVLGAITWRCGISIFRFLWFIRDELWLVLGTSSSETALPQLMQKLQRLGCAKSTVGIVVPTGYSFNLDGTNIYMAMAAVFLAQATNTSLSLYDQIGLLVIAMVTSKGASGVTGAGFVTLAATLQAVPSIPVESIGLLLGIDRFMSECRALTNFIGNGVATIAVSRWEGELDGAELARRLAEAETESVQETSPTP